MNPWSSTIYVIGSLELVYGGLKPQKNNILRGLKDQWLIYNFFFQFRDLIRNSRDLVVY